MLDPYLSRTVDQGIEHRVPNRFRKRSSSRSLDDLRHPTQRLQGPTGSQATDHSASSFSKHERATIDPSLDECARETAERCVDRAAPNRVPRGRSVWSED